MYWLSWSKYFLLPLQFGSKVKLGCEDLRIETLPITTILVDCGATRHMMRESKGNRANNLKRDRYMREQFPDLKPDWKLNFEAATDFWKVEGCLSKSTTLNFVRVW